MYFFATGHVTRPGEIGRYLEEEKRILVELREQGVVREAFSAMGRGRGPASVRRRVTRR
jgi:hypothetical protein